MTEKLTLIDFLACPICKSAMNAECGENGRLKSLYCVGAKRHSYDFSSSGYVNLAPPSQSNGGDSKSAVRSRTAFLDMGHYSKIANMICDMLKKHCRKDGIVIDAGCGEGYYTSKISENNFSTLGFDLSKFAVEHAAKRQKNKKDGNSFFGVASVFNLPIQSNSVDAIVNVFAPCAENEFKRVLKDEGVLIVVYAGKNHLLGLKKVIYDTTYTNEDRADLPSDLEHLETLNLTYTVDIEGKENIKNLFAMTPYYWKTSKEDVEKLENQNKLTTEIDILFSVYKNHHD